MFGIESYVDDIEQKSDVWKSGWNSYKDNPYSTYNPYPKGTNEHEQFEEGWDEAQFCIQVDSGYYDWTD